MLDKADLTAQPSIGFPSDGLSTDSNSQLDAEVDPVGRSAACGSVVHVNDGGRLDLVRNGDLAEVQPRPDLHAVGDFQPPTRAGCTDPLSLGSFTEPAGFDFVDETAYGVLKGDERASLYARNRLTHIILQVCESL